MTDTEQPRTIGQEIRRLVTNESPATRKDLALVLASVTAAMDAVTSSHVILSSEPDTEAWKRSSDEYNAAIIEFYETVRDAITILRGENGKES